MAPTARSRRRCRTTSARRGLEVQQMLARVRDEVAANGGKQLRWSNLSPLGEVYLAN